MSTPAEAELLGARLVQKAQAAIRDSFYEDELLEVWAAREQATLSQAKTLLDDAGDSAWQGKKVSSDLLPPQIRTATVWVFSQVIDGMGLPANLLGKSIMLIDDYIRKERHNDYLAELPDTCVVIGDILFKANLTGMEACLAGRRLRTGMAWLQAWTQSKGLTPPTMPTGVEDDSATPGQEDTPPSTTTSGVKERNVLRALKWQIDPVTADSWMEAFCARFDLATTGVFKASLDWMVQQNLQLTRSLVRRSPYYEQDPQRLSALGIFAYGLVAARILRADHFRPAGVDAAQWEALFRRIAPPPITAFMPEDSQRKLFCLCEVATLEQMDTLRAACHEFLAGLPQQDAQ